MVQGCHRTSRCRSTLKRLRGLREELHLAVDALRAGDHVLELPLEALLEVAKGSPAATRSSELFFFTQ